MSRPIVLMLLLSALSLGSCAHTATPTANTDTITETTMNIIKSPLDTRVYDYFVLPNGLQAMVISDPTVDMAAASLGIHIGQFSDPADRLGMAHFLEHMLFMGTEKYPDVDDYRNYIQSHGGGSNAGTGQENTTYYFTIDHNFLEGGLDRFSQFFVSPLLKPEFVERERNAVNSEYSLKIKTEARRVREVMRKTSNPAHPFSKFSVGNLETLADTEQSTVHQDMRIFYEREYSASKMTMAVLGRESVAELRTMVEAMFSAVPSDGSQIIPTTVAPFLPEQLGAQISITPLSEHRSVQMQFPAPPSLQHFPNKPTDYITSLLGHEGEGSLFSLLKGKGWAESLSTGSDGADDYELITIDISLTRDGFAHLDDVVSTVFQAIRQVRAEGVVARIFDEQTQIKNTKFAYKEVSDSSVVVRSIVGALHTLPPENALDNHYLLGDFNKSLIDGYLDLMTPDNLRLVVIGEGLTTDMVEPLYDVPYGVTPLDAQLKENWNASPIHDDLAIPAKNAFIATDFTLFEGGDSPTIPAKLATAPGVTTWHLLDTSFEVPRAGLVGNLYTPAVQGSAKNAVMNSLYVSLFNDNLTEFNYPLLLAGMGIGVGSSKDGMQLAISGYNEKQEVLAEALGSRLSEFRPNEDRFALQKELTLRNLRNSKKQRPISQAYWALGKIMSPDSYNADERVAALETVSLDDLLTFIDGYYAHASLKLLFHGNLDTATTTAMATTLGGYLADSTDPADIPPVRTSIIPANTTIIRQFEVDHNDSTFIKVYQGTNDDIITQAMYKMLGQVLKTPFFSELRTNQQLGYMVWATASSNDRIPSINCAIQSANTDPAELQKRVETFLADYHTIFAAMDSAEFETLKEGLIATLEEDETQLGDRTSRFSYNLSKGYTDFDYREQIVKSLQGLTHEQMVAFYNSELLADSARSLVVRSFGNDTDSVALECADVACVADQLSISERAR